MHIQKEHPSEAQSKMETKGNKEVKKETNRQKNRKSEKSEKKGGVSKRKFKIGKTEVRLWDYEHLDVKEQRVWLMFQNRNYVAGLHKQRVGLSLLVGRSLRVCLRLRILTLLVC